LYLYFILNLSAQQGKNFAPKKNGIIFKAEILNYTACCSTKNF